MKKILLLLPVLVLIVFASVKIFSPEDSWLCVNGTWTKHGNPSSAVPSSGCDQISVTNVTGMEINFSETGHLIKDNPGFKQGVWYLSYEKPGAPALSVELLFDSDSTCKYGTTTGKCPDVLLPSSALTEVKGNLKDGVVRVYIAQTGI